MYRRFDADTTLSFGKHKGYQIQWLLKNDPQYLVWMYEKFEDTEWTDVALSLVVKAIDIVAEDRKLDYGDAYDNAMRDDRVF